MALDYGYNPEVAGAADKMAERATDSGAYVGELKKVYTTVSGNKGTHGLVCEFEAPGQGNAEFTLWTHDNEGKAMTGSPGYAMFNALLFLLGVKNPEVAKGTAEVWVDGAGGKREKVEQEVDIFPELCGKKIGIVLQKEVQDKGFRMNLYGLFEPTTRRTMTEVRDGVTKGVKLDRLLKGLKDKDGRTKGRSSEGEPGQPSTGMDMAD
jgi:hypothetical protein